MEFEQDFSSSYHQVRFMYDPERATVWRPICRYVAVRWRRTRCAGISGRLRRVSRFTALGELLDINRSFRDAAGLKCSPSNQSVAKLSLCRFEPGTLGTVLVTSELVRAFHALDECRTILPKRSVAC